MDEFALIRRYFDWPADERNDIELAVGDDAAIIHANGRLAISTDMLIAGRHFPESTAADAIAHKALAVNLSDMAAMGAQPLAFTLSLGIPAADSTWLALFAQGLSNLAQKHDCALIGGDTVRASQLTINITVFGQLPEQSVIRRDQARVGDQLCISGPIGDAALGLKLALKPENTPAGLAPEYQHYLRQRLDRPEPRVTQAVQAVGLAHAGLDISDGLLQDAAHLATASNVGLMLDLTRLPISDAAQAWLALRPEDADLLPRGGDDYELLLTVPVEALSAMETLGFTRIGEVSTQVQSPGVYSSSTGKRLDVAGFRHFQ